MRAAALLAALVVLPGFLYVLLFQGLGWLCGGDRPWFARALVRLFGWTVPLVRRVPRPAVVVDGLERVGLLTRRRTEPVPPVLLVLELRRLAAEVRRIESTDHPYPAARLAAALAAYDHVLVQLCSHASLPTPIGLLPLDPRDRLGLETDLVASGVDW